MWPFATRGNRFLGDAATRSPSAMAGTDFNDNDAVIKLWLPGLADLEPDPERQLALRGESNLTVGVELCPYFGNCIHW